MLWGHPALIPALLLAESFTQQGAKLKLGSVMGVDDIPYYVYTDTDGEQIALPCTERLYTERQAVQVGQYRVMPLLSIRGRPELRLGSFTSQAGTPLAGFWAPVAIKPAPATPPAAAAPAASPAPRPAVPAQPEPAPIPEAVATPAPPPEPPPAPSIEPDAASDGSDLDALLAGLSAPAETPPAEPQPAAAADAADDLDKLLASLNAEPPPPEEDATEPDLDALLASLQ